MFGSLRCALLGSTALVVTGFTPPALAQTRTFDLPAQPAVNSIPMFAKQAGIQIVAPADKLAGVNTRAIHGQLDRHQALTKLLEGTPLVVSSDDGTVVILQVAEKKSPPVAAPARAKPTAALETDAGEHPLEEVVVSGY